MNLVDVVEKGLGQGGASIVLAGQSTAVNLRLANNTVTTNGLEESLSGGVAVIDQGKVGVQGADLSDSSQVLQLAGAARERAAQSPEAPDVMPLLTVAEAASSRPQEETAEVGPAHLRPVLAGIQRALEQSRADNLRCYGYAHLTSDRELLGLDTGVRLEGRRDAASLSLTLKTDDLTRSVWAGGLGLGLDSIDVDAMYQRLRQRLAWTERRIELEAGRYQVILEPAATAEFMLRLYWEMYSRGADESRTIFGAGGGSRVGERMYAEGVTIDSDPHDPRMPVPDFVRSLGSSEYSSIFDCGLEAGATVWVDRGVQQDLICPRRWARDHGHPVRPDVDNLRMRGTDRSLEQMISSTERALLVTSLWYIRDVDPSTLLLTGLTRDGVFLVEKGEVVGAVNNFRFNESPVGVFSRAVEIGRPEVTLPRETGDLAFVEAPPVRVERFFMSSVSDAI